MQMSLGELRALRDSYRARAERALATHWHKPMGALLDECARSPIGQLDGMAFLAERIFDYTDWAAVTRYVWLCDLVWEAESDRVDHLRPFARRRAA